MHLTLTHLLTRALARFPDRVAIEDGTGPVTYGELDAHSDALANGLRAIGVNAGSCVALYLRNSKEYVISDLAVLKLGAIKVPLNEYLSPQELRHILTETETAVLIAHTSLLAGLDGAMDDLRQLITVVGVDDGTPTISEGPLLNWEAVCEARTRPPVSANASAPAVISYTGGTTGRPKGVVQTQSSLAINCLAHVVSGDIRSEDVLLLTTPLPHSAGYHLQAALLQGSQVVLRQRFDPATFIETVRSHRVTWTFLVPTMIYRLLDQLGNHAAPDELRTIVYGAAPMSPMRLQAALEKFGYVFIQLYGQTECPNYITTLTRDDHRHPSLHGSCGKPVAFVDVATTGKHGIGPGEVIIQAPYLLKEYLKNPEATQASLRDGWLYTGDIGYLDENGYLFLIDRAKDMIITGGMNVYSIEVEQVLKSHPAIADAAVIGVPHDDWGEQVQAVVVTRSAVSSEALIDFCRQHLSRYKVPKAVAFRNSLPLTPYGKVDKKALRERAG